MADDHCHPILVGGAHPEFSWIPLKTGSSPDSASPENLACPQKPEHLAQVTFSAGVKNLVSRGPVWDVQMIPRRHKASNAATHMQHMGELLAAACQANGGKGPLVLAYDAHANHGLVTPVAMGLASHGQSGVACAETPFFKDCRFEPLAANLPAFPFKQLRYNDDDLMFATLDAGHVQKAMARAVRSSVRKVKIGQFFATCLVLCEEMFCQRLEGSL